MDIYYSLSGQVLSTFSRDSSTTVRDGITTGLLAVGWTALASTYEGGVEVKWLQSGSDFWGNYCKVRLRLTTGHVRGPNVEIAFVSPTDDVGFVHMISQKVGCTNTMIASELQFFVFDTSFPVGYPNEVMGGLLWNDGKLSIWSLADYYIFDLFSGFTKYLAPSRYGEGSAYVDGVGMSKTGDTNFIRPNIYVLRPASLVNTFADTCSRFADGVGALTQVPVSMGLAEVGTTYIRGYMYDAVVAMQSYTIGQIFNFDEHDWYNLTDQNIYGSLLLTVREAGGAKGYTY